VKNLALADVGTEWLSWLGGVGVRAGVVARARGWWLLALLLSAPGCGEEPEPAATVDGGGNGANSAGSPAVAGTGSGVLPSGGAPIGGSAASQGGALAGQGGAVAGSGGAGTAGAAPVEVGVFVAQGHEGRITRSCDGGRTFPYDDSADDGFRCFSDAEHDCDHSTLAGRGLAFGKGSFVATWGWGHPGTLRRSVDGAVFEDVMRDTPTFADVAYGNGLFVACGNPTRVSSDGKTWEVGGKLGFDFNYRGIEFVPTQGGLFVVTGESSEQRAISTSKDGKTWQLAGDRPATCGQELRGIAGSPDVMLVASGQGHVCFSSDGDVWQQVQVSERFTSPPLWTGSEFVIYAGAQQLRSADAKLWTPRDIEPKSIAIGALARSPDGTYVAANDGWQVWYEKQHFYRSSDGVSWETLPAEAFTASHPINFISFGYVPASAGCGAP
jgi:hypothetical protein